MRLRRHSSARPRGFTLAESLFAIGIVSSALLVIVGVVPVGLENLHQTEVHTAESRIFRSIVSEYEALPALSSAQNQGRRRYFDLSGLEVRDSQGFTAFAAEPTLQKEPVPPGAADTYLYKLKVKIIPWQGGTPTNDLLSKTHSTVLVEMEPTP
jgi:uncharacterized protein (TIGR02598 family)